MDYRMLTKTVRSMLGDGNSVEEAKIKAYALGQAASARAHDAQAGYYNEQAREKKLRTDALHDPQARIKTVARMLGVSDADLPDWNEYIKSGNTRFETAPARPGYYAPKVELNQPSGRASFEPTGEQMNAFPFSPKFSGTSPDDIAQAEQIGALDVLRTMPEAPLASVDLTNFVPDKPAQYRELNPEMVKQFNAQLGNLMAGLQMTGNTNLDQHQNAVTENLKQRAIYGQPAQLGHTMNGTVPAGEISGGGYQAAQNPVMEMTRQMMQMSPGMNPADAAKKAQELLAVEQAMMGVNHNPQVMALFKASPIYGASGENHYTDTVGNQMRFREGQASARNNADNATSRRNMDVSQETERWKHTTRGANGGNSDLFKIRDDIRAQYNTEYPISSLDGKRPKGAPIFDAYERAQLNRLGVSESDYFGGQRQVTNKPASQLTQKQRDYQEYKQMFDEAAGNVERQRALTEFARSKGLLK